MRSVDTLRNTPALQPAALPLSPSGASPIVSTVLKVLNTQMHLAIDTASSTNTHLNKNFPGSPSSTPGGFPSAPLSAEQRVLDVLEQRPAANSPSLADQILYLMFNSSSPLEDAELARTVAYLMDQPSTQDARKTNAQLISDSLRGATVPSRVRRDTNHVPPAALPGPLSPGALVLKGDSEMALLFADEMAASYAYTFIKGEPPREENIHDIPPFSTFGIAWAKLSEALNSEPFATFTQNNNIDLSTIRISTRTGELSCVADDQPRTFTLRDNSGWSGVSAAVLAAAKRLAPGRDDRIDFQASDRAPLNIVGNFYNVGSLNGRLYAIKYLNTFKTFHDIRTAESPHGFSQRQQAAIHYVNGLTQAQRDALGGVNIEQTPTQRVDADDHRLARLCSRSAIGSAFKIRDINDSSDVINEIPEYSTFGQAQKKFRQALTTNEFKTFIREQSIDLTSISVDPTTSSLRCMAKGKDTVFTLNDLSGWSQIASPIVEAAARLTTGKSEGANYSTLTTASLSQVLRFYAEVIPVGGFARNFQACTDLSHNSFSAFASTTATSGRYRAVREQQHALKQELANTLPSVDVDAPAPTPPRVQTRASGDSELAVLVSDTMLALKQDNSTDASRVIANIPAHSAFGQWWAHITQAFEGRALTEWAQQQKIDLDTLVFDPAINALKAKANGVDRVFLIKDFAHDYPELFDALTPLANAANVLVPFSQPIMIAKPSSPTAAPFALVFNFYGGNTGDLSSPGFVKLAHDMKRAKAFPDTPEDPQRSEAALQNQKVMLGNNNDRNALASRLKLALSGTQLDHTHVRVNSNSSHQPKGIRTAKEFIIDNGWKVPRNKDEIANLLLALRTPVPQREPLADLWGFLSTPVPLTTAQREQVAQVVKAQLGTSTGLFNYLAPTSDTLGADLKQNLEQLLSSDKAQALGQELQTQLKGFPTSTSISQWILTALVLELDPKADDKRNSIAGFDFMQTANWGRPASELLGKFTQHLTDTHKIGAAIAPTATHVLLSGKAPQFLVKELPSTLIYGTPAWTSFNTAVNRIEQMAPGAVATMTYRQVMDFHKVAPLSKVEERHLARAQMNPVIDWGVINGVIPKNDKDEYAQENVQLCLDRLNQQEKETAAAVKYLGRTQAPTRRSMALANLKAKFGPDIPYEVSNLRRANDSTLQDRWASVVELYEAKQLGDAGWETDDTRIPIQRLRDQAGELPDVNTQFDTAINNDYATRRSHSMVAIKDLLSKLPLEDRNNLNYSHVSYYSVRESDTSLWQHLQAKTGKKGSHGILIRAKDQKGDIHDYALFPDVAVIKKIPNLPDPMPIGGTNKAFGKIYDGRDEGTHRLPLDFTAFTSAATPRDGVTSNVIVDRVDVSVRTGDEMVSEGVWMPQGPDTSRSPTYFGGRFENIAKTVVDSHFLRKDEFEALNRGHNAFEAAPMTFLERLNFLARMVPGVSSIEDVIEGKYAQAGIDLLIDALSIVVAEGVGKVWTLAGEAVERATANTAKNLLIKGVAEETAEAAAAFKDMSALAAAQESTPLNRMQSRDFQAETNTLRTRPDITDGTIIQSGRVKGYTKLTAAYREGLWYAYDIQTKSIYGPPLEGFVPDTSLPLVKVKGPDGTQVLTTQKPLTDNAFVIDRPGYSDIIDGNKVYRFRPENLNVITDLESPESLVKEEDFEAFCPAPTGRIKRGLNDLCFTRVIEASPTSHQLKLQAIDHQRLFPAPIRYNGTRTVVFERKLYNVVSTDAGETLKPHEFTSPIKYKDTIPGTTVPDKYFGFPNKNFDKKFENETRIVRLGAISDISNDQRELRAIIVPALNGSEKHLVVEADTGVFYHRNLTAPESTPFEKIEFKNYNSRASKLIKRYTKIKEKYYVQLGEPKNNNFVALPPMDSIYIHLRAKGNSIESIQKLKEGISSLTAEKQREFAMMVWNKGKVRDIDIALKPVRLPSLTKPNDFINFTESEKNKYFAHEAKKAVDEQIAATGIGPANLRTLSNPADAERLKTSNSVTAWLYERIKLASDSSLIDTVMKTGAGNCDQMAYSAARIIQKNGGSATVMAMDKHAFTVVGDVNPNLKTTDFSEPAWKDLWISDPWAEIECPAPEYIRRFGEKMQEWKAKGQQIRGNDGVWIDADDPEWIRGTVGSVKSFG